MSTLEDEIRRIVREEIARTSMVAPYTDAPDDVLYSSAPIVPRRSIFDPNKRTGCACPVGAQTSCPDATCPWKPR